MRSSSLLAPSSSVWQQIGRRRVGAAYSLSRVAAHPLHDGADRSPAWSVRVPRLLLFVPCDAGYVEMDPRCVSSKLLEEHRRGDRAPVAVLAGVHDVGDLALDVVAIVVGAGKPPALL